MATAVTIFLVFSSPFWGEMSAHAGLVTIHNDIPRRDTAGNILNAHDGGVYRFNQTYFMYGTVYENCTQGGTQCTAPCGYNPNRFALYTSPDLMVWTLQTSDLVPEMSKDSNVINYWMPNVQMNPKTKKYVMQYWSTHCGFRTPCANIAVADSPYGPFTVVPPIALHGGTPSSQMGMFVDGDGTAYVKYNTVGPTQHHAVEKLAEDWLSSTGEWAIVFWKPTLPWMEGGGMFKRGDLYYYMTGSDCCFCTWGGDARVWTARQPLGPWHPGIAPPLPTLACDLTGMWTSGGDLGNETLTLTQEPGSNNFTFRDASGTAMGWIDPATGYVTFPPSAGDARGVLTSGDGTQAGCDRVRWYGYESFIWCRQGVSCPLPSYKDAFEVNYCADGSEPAQVCWGFGVIDAAEVIFVFSLSLTQP